MSRAYLIQHAAEVGPATPFLAINNPADSLDDLRIVRIGNGLADSTRLVVFAVERYAGLVTGGTAAQVTPGDSETTPTYPRVTALSSGDPAPSSEAFSGAFALPGARVFDTTVVLESREGAASSIALDPPIVAAPGESLVITLIETDHDSARVLVGIEEVRRVPIPYLDGTLPSAGAWLAGGWFALPHEWTEVALHLVYTAANPAVLPRPKIRARWRAGGTVEAPQPIIDAVDTTSPPVARRLQRVLEETLDPIVAGATVTHAFVYARLPGFGEVAFDVAELGATITPGAVVALITGR